MVDTLSPLAVPCLIELQQCVLKIYLLLVLAEASPVCVYSKATSIRPSGRSELDLHCYRLNAQKYLSMLLPYMSQTLTYLNLFSSLLQQHELPNCRAYASPTSLHFDFIKKRMTALEAFTERIGV